MTTEMSTNTPELARKIITATNQKTRLEKKRQKSIQNGIV